MWTIGVLNSAVGNFFFSRVCAKLEGEGECYYEFRAQFVERFPIPNTETDADKKRAGEIESCVKKLTAAMAKFGSAKTDKSKRFLESKCREIDSRIDSLCFELYRLTEEETQIIIEVNKATATEPSIKKRKRRKAPVAIEEPDDLPGEIQPMLFD